MALKNLLVGFLLVAVEGQSVRRGHSVDARSAFDEGLYERVLDPAQCRRQLDYLTNSSLSFRFLDASAKLPSGIMTGNVNDLGDYWQCLGINELIDNLQFQGKYCAILVPLDQEFELPSIPELPEIPWPPVGNDTISTALQYQALQRYALGVSGYGEPVESRIFPMVTTAVRGSTLSLCIPHVCTTKEVIDFFQQQIPSVNFTYADYFCRLPNDKPYSAADYTAMAIFGIITCAVIFSTFYDLYCCFVLKNPKAASVLYRCFSVYTNTRRFLTFNHVPGAIECIDGIRAISMMWVVVGHTYCFTLLAYIHNLEDTINKCAYAKKGCTVGCECQGSGLTCKPICGTCQGVACTNTEMPTKECDDDSDPDDPDAVA